MSRLLWHEGIASEGIAIQPQGAVSKLVNDGHVSVERATCRPALRAILVDSAASAHRIGSEASSTLTALGGMHTNTCKRFGNHLPWNHPMVGL